MFGYVDFDPNAARQHHTHPHPNPQQQFAHAQVHPAHSAMPPMMQPVGLAQRAYQQHQQQVDYEEDLSVLGKLQKAMHIIRANEIEGSSVESDHCLIQVWFPDEHKRLQNCVVACTKSEEYTEEQVASTLTHFGERSKLYKFQVDGGAAEGLPGRVFVSGRPEMTLDVQRYGKANYLRIDEAINCGIKASVGIPVYSRGPCESDSLDTVAVVEISKVSEKLNMERLSCKLADVFESVDLHTWGRESPSVKFRNWPYNVHVQRTGAILNTLVEAVCQISGIQYASIWGRYTGGGMQQLQEGNGKQLTLLSCDALPCGVQNSSFIEYRQSCTSKIVFEGFGFVGSAWKKECTMWHSQVAGIPEGCNPYRGFNVANFKGGVVAVPITLAKGLEEEGEEDSKYVMEVFITDLCPDTEQQRRLIVNMLSLLLRIGGGRFEIGVLLEFWMPKAELALALTSGEEGQQAPPSNEGGEGNKAKGKGPKKREAADADLKEGVDGDEEKGGSSSKKKGNSKKKAIPLENLQRYFKYNLREAAKRLGVCPTTLKRVCRQYGIPRWPCRKLKKVNRSINKLQGVVESVPGVEASAIGFPDLKAACVFDTSASELSNSSHGLGQGSAQPPAVTSNLKPSSPNKRKSVLGNQTSQSPEATVSLDDRDRAGQSAGALDNKKGKKQSVGLPPGNLHHAVQGNLHHAVQSNLHHAAAQMPMPPPAMVHYGNNAVAAPVAIPAPAPHRGMYYDPQRAHASWPDERPSTLQHVASSHSIEYVASPPINQPILAADPGVQQSNNFPAMSNTSNMDSVDRRGGGTSVKATYKESTMRFKLTPETGYSEIVSQVNKHFGLTGKGLVLKYLDEENDWISLKGNEDLSEALDSSQQSLNHKQIIRIKVEVKK